MLITSKDASANFRIQDQRVLGKVTNIARRTSQNPFQISLSVKLRKNVTMAWRMVCRNDATFRMTPQTAFPSELIPDQIHLATITVALGMCTVIKSQNQRASFFIHLGSVCVPNFHSSFPVSLIAFGIFLTPSHTHFPARTTRLGISVI